MPGTGSLCRYVNTTQLTVAVPSMLPHFAYSGHPDLFPGLHPSHPRASLSPFGSSIWWTDSPSALLPCHVAEHVAGNAGESCPALHCLHDPAEGRALCQASQEHKQLSTLCVVLPQSGFSSAYAGREPRQCSTACPPPPRASDSNPIPLPSQPGCCAHRS